MDENLILASYTLGHSEYRTALKVVLPLSEKGIVAGTILSFARAMGEFGATLMIAGRTNNMPLAIYSAAGSGDQSWATIMVIVFTLFSGIFLYITSKLSRRIL